MTRTIVNVVRLPAQLDPQDAPDHAVAVFDVLRATTSIVAALGAGAREIHVFGSIEAARAGANGRGVTVSDRLLCGEVSCLPPEGFDMGNSPVELAGARVMGKVIYLSTTNGTRAIVAARAARRMFAAAVTNASASARALLATELPVTLLCSGSNGFDAPEDVCGAGAVIDAMKRHKSLALTDSAVAAHELFDRHRDELHKVFRKTIGGRNIIAAGLEPDIDFAARLDAYDLVAEVDLAELIVRGAGI